MIKKLIIAVKKTLNFTLLQDKGDFLNEISENLLEKNGKA